MIFGIKGRGRGRRLLAALPSDSPNGRDQDRHLVSPRVQLVRPNAAHARRRFSIGNDGALRNLEISDQSLQLSRMAGRRLPAGFPQWLATFLF